MGSWLSKQLEPTSAHFTYLILSLFLLFYALFSSSIRNRLHLSEPPLATLVGIAAGPAALDIVNPEQWHWQDAVTQEAARVILVGDGGVCVWVVGDEVEYGVGDKCVFGAYGSGVGGGGVGGRAVFGEGAEEVEAYVECGETSFPFLYAGLLMVLRSSTGDVIRAWLLATILWQCSLGLLVGLVLGKLSNRALRLAERRDWIDPSSFLAFYLLLALFSVGIGSTLGLDDFLVAFGAGTGFASDGWFANKTKEAALSNILELILNSSMFVYFGAIIPWEQFVPRDITPTITLGKLFGLLVLVLLFRRIPIVLLLKRFIPDIRTYREALFCGHFGPMGLGGLFLVIEARAQLETGESIPLPRPPKNHPLKQEIEQVWPIVCFVLLGSTFVHGCSVAAISVAGHYMRPKGERAPLLAGEIEGLDGMVHEGGGGESEPSVSGDED
ncbi:hypothetical protein Q9189_007002, partial [Teloschistes chrysophthalmus]